MGLPELLAAGAGYVIGCLSIHRQDAHDLSRDALLLGQGGCGTFLIRRVSHGSEEGGRDLLLMDIHRRQGGHRRLHPAGCARRTGSPEASAHAC